MGLEVINELKKQKKLTNEQLSELSGIPLGTVAKITSGVTKDPKLDTLKALARVLGCTLDYFDDRGYSVTIPLDAKEIVNKYMGLDRYGKEAVKAITDIEHRRCEQVGEQSATYDVPLLGKTAAGEPISYADPSYDIIQVKAIPQGAEFALVVAGDSMEPTIKDGSIVFVKPQEAAENGQIVIAEVNGEVTCKKYYKDEYGDIELRSINPNYDPIDDFESFRIIGKVLL